MDALTFAVELPRFFAELATPDLCLARSAVQLPNFADAGAAET